MPVFTTQRDFGEFDASRMELSKAVAGAGLIRPKNPWGERLGPRLGQGAFADLETLINSRKGSEGDLPLIRRVAAGVLP